MLDVCVNDVDDDDDDDDDVYSTVYIQMCFLLLGMAAIRATCDQASWHNV